MVVFSCLYHDPQLGRVPFHPFATHTFAPALAFANDKRLRRPLSCRGEIRSQANHPYSENFCPNGGPFSLRHGSDTAWIVRGSLSIVFFRLQRVAADHCCAVRGNIMQCNAPCTLAPTATCAARPGVGRYADLGVRDGEGRARARARTRKRRRKAAIRWWRRSPRRCAHESGFHS